MLEQPMLANFKRTLTTLNKTTVLDCALWVAYALAGAVLAICIPAVVPWTFVSCLAAGWIAGATYLIVVTLLELLRHTDFSKAANGATKTTDTPRSEYPLPPVATVERPLHLVKGQTSHGYLQPEYYPPEPTINRVDRANWNGNM